jgi:hypothetical protein
MVVHKKEQFQFIVTGIRNEAIYVTLSDGRRALQLLPTKRDLENHRIERT